MHSMTTLSADPTSRHAAGSHFPVVRLLVATALLSALAGALATAVLERVAGFGALPALGPVPPGTPYRPEVTDTRDAIVPADGETFGEPATPPSEPPPAS